MSKHQNGKTATPEFIHYTRKYNRDIPSATHENLVVLLKFYNFKIQRFILEHNKHVGIIERHTVCFLNEREIYLGSGHSPSDFVAKPALLLDVTNLKLLLQSLCNRHELPVKTIDFIALLDLNEFVVSDVVAE